MEGITRIVGHRGGKGLWPENTIAGFRKAVAAGVDFVELDIHLSSDNAVIVMHDATLERTSEGSGAVVGKTVEELSRIPLKDAGGECIATLDTVLASLKHMDVGFFIEFKTDPLAIPYPDIEQRTIDLLDYHDVRSRTIALSFVPEILERIREIWPAAPVLTPFHRGNLQILGGLWNALDRFNEIPGCFINIHNEILPYCHEAVLDRIGMDRLGVGGVNHIADLERWMGLDIATLVTDFPDRAVAVRSRIAEKR